MPSFFLQEEFWYFIASILQLLYSVYPASIFVYWVIDFYASKLEGNESNIRLAIDGKKWSSRKNSSNDTRQDKTYIKLLLDLQKYHHSSMYPTELTNQWGVCCIDPISSIIPKKRGLHQNVLANQWPSSVHNVLLLPNSLLNAFQDWLVEVTPDII